MLLWSPLYEHLSCDSEDLTSHDPRQMGHGPWVVQALKEWGGSHSVEVVTLPFGTSVPTGIIQRAHDDQACLQSLASIQRVSAASDWSCNMHVLAKHA